MAATDKLKKQHLPESASALLELISDKKGVEKVLNDIAGEQAQLTQLLGQYEDLKSLETLRSQVESAKAQLDADRARHEQSVASHKAQVEKDAAGLRAVKNAIKESGLA